MGLKSSAAAVLFTAIITSFISCAPTRFVQPLQQGTHAISGNVGGALIEFGGAVIPLPLTAVTYGYGATDNLTAFGSLHTTSLLFGTVQMEGGALYQISTYDSLNPWIPGISVNCVLNFAADTWEGNARLWPQLDVNFYRHFNQNRHLVYLGASNWFELAGTRAHGQPQQVHVLFNPHLGFSTLYRKTNHSLEFKMLMPFHSNENIVVDYVSPIPGKGAAGIYYSFSRQIGRN